MSDKSWMLNAKAIARAKECIKIVEAELGIRLKLSNPDFLELLIDYAELNESQALQQGLSALAEFAPVDLQESMRSTVQKEEDKANFQGTDSGPKTNPSEDIEEVVIYRGKSYPRFRNGLEFQGLYRGQASYT